jgi:hypothetical protein
VIYGNDPTPFSGLVVLPIRVQHVTDRDKPGAARHGTRKGYAIDDSGQWVIVTIGGGE